MQMSGADIVIEYLKAEGVTHVFGVVGSSILDLMDSLARSPQIRYVQTQHEQAAAYMADGYARVTGRPGVCVATVGPGATNLIGGVAQAFLESSPVLALCGEVHTLQKPADLIPAYRRALASMRPALVDVVIGNDWDELEAPTKLRVADRY